MCARALKPGVGALDCCGWNAPAVAAAVVVPGVGKVVVNCLFPEGFLTLTNLMERLSGRYHRPKPSLLLPDKANFSSSCVTSGLARRLDSSSDPDGGATTSAMTITPASGGPPHQQLGYRNFHSYIHWAQLGGGGELPSSQDVG